MTPHWLCTRIYFHDTDKDALLAECIAPLHASLVENGAQDIILERDWRGGPHLTLYVSMQALEQRLCFEELIRRTAEQYLRHSPSTRALGEAEARRVHMTLSRFEASRDTFIPLHPDNSIVITDEEPRCDTYPSPGAWALANKTAAATLPLVLATMVEAGADRGVKHAAVVTMLLTYADLLGPIEYSYFFMRAYVEKVIALPPNDPASVRARLDLVYQQRREVMREMLTHHASGKRTALEERWAAMLGEMYRCAQAAVEAGTHLIWRNAEANNLYSNAGWNVDAELAGTEFLKSWRSNDVAWRKFDESPFYRSHMFFVNQMYRLLHLLGISAQEKLVMFSMVSSAIEEQYAINPLERIEHS